MMWPWRRRTGFTESANFNISFPPPGIFSQNKSLRILREGLKDKVRMVEMSMNRFAHIEKLTCAIRISESNSNEELHQNNSLEMNQRLILIFKFDTEFIEPIKRKRQELEIQNADTNYTKNFINKSKDRYSIWRIKYKNPVSDFVLKSYEGPNYNGRSRLCELLQVKK